MSDRMQDILGAGEENRQADIELGRQLERERILEGLKDWSVNGNGSNDLVRLIKGEN